MTPLPPDSAALSGQLNTALLQRWEKSVKAPNQWSAKGNQKKSVELTAREQEKEPLRTMGCD